MNALYTSKTIAYLIAPVLWIGAVGCQSNSPPQKSIQVEETVSSESKKNEEVKKIFEVASFKGQQVTGVTVCNTEENGGRIFANFPRWREGVEQSVIEVLPDGSTVPYPNSEWNQWEIGAEISDHDFVAVQSVIAFENELYVLDTRNPQFEGVLDNPRIFVFDISSNQLKRTYVLSEGSFYSNSYINDLRVDSRLGKIYCTDSERGGIVVIDLESGECLRALDRHPSTSAEVDHLNFDNGKWEATVHSDGIALDSKNNRLYYHALTGYNLYFIPTDALASGDPAKTEAAVEFVAQTPAPDGMIIDEEGNLYLADLEKNAIVKMNLATREISTIGSGDKIKWADTFGIYDDYLYFTNSRINEAQGEIDHLVFSIQKLKLHPQKSN